jgi:hypothetical protein
MRDEIREELAKELWRGIGNHSRSEIPAPEKAKTAMIAVKLQEARNLLSQLTVAIQAFDGVAAKCSLVTRPDSVV